MATKDDFHGIEKWFTVLQNFYIEVLATLVPGILFTCSVGCLFALFAYKIGYGPMLIKIFKSVDSASLFVAAILVASLVAVSYAAGAVFYRRSPNNPDNLGSYRHYTRHKGQSMMVDFKGIYPCRLKMIFWKLSMCRIFPSPFPSTVNYPYPNIGDYLKGHKFNWLTKYCAWDGQDVHTRHNVNILKQIIRTAGRQDVSFDTVRNESHVRMMSAIWYEVLCLRALSIVLFVLVYVLNSLSHATVCVEAFTVNELAIIICAWLFIWYALRSIEDGIHSMRQRELIMVLEYAYLLDSLSKQIRKSNRTIDLTALTSMYHLDLFENVKSQTMEKE